MIRETPVYSVICDNPECGISAQDSGEHVGWTDVGIAIDDAVYADWYVGTDRHLCEDCAPRCIVPDCLVSLRNDEFGTRCEDHADV